MRFYWTLLLFLSPLFAPGQTMLKFIDTAGNFTAQYPDSWELKIKAGNRVFFTSPSDGGSDTFYENINISVSENEDTENLTVEDLGPEVTEMLKSNIANFKEESNRIFKWNDTDAVEVIYTATAGEEGLKIRCTQWYCYYKSRLYIVTFVAAQENNSHNETARKIMNSIIFK